MSRLTNDDRRCLWIALIARRAISSKSRTTNKTPTMKRTNARHPNSCSPCNSNPYEENSKILSIGESVPCAPRL
jgi:hypothetical protein